MIRSQLLEEGMEGLLGTDNVFLPGLGASYRLCHIYDQFTELEMYDLCVFLSICFTSTTKKNTASLFPAPKEEGRKCIQDFLPTL